MAAEARRGGSGTELGRLPPRLALTAMRVRPTAVTGTAARFVSALGLALGLVFVVATLAGCADDEGDLPPTPRPSRITPATISGASGTSGAASKGQLVERLHIEDRVDCPIPDEPTDPKGGGCDPKAPSCLPHLYCLPLAQGSYCEPCPERDGIRHVFSDRDFAVEQNRDPFLSNLWSQLPIGKADAILIDPTKKCVREDQMVATSYSYAELKLVGIVVQGTQRKVLMMGGPLGYIIKRGDCVGKEKAVVKDIGAGYITFLVDPDGAIASRRTPEEYSVQLNPKQLAVAGPEIPAPAPRATATTPVPVPPPAVPPSRAGSGAAAAPPGEAPPVAPKKP